MEVTIFGKSSADRQPTVDESLRQLVDEVSIDVDDVKAIVVKLRKYLTEDLAALGPDDIAEWGTVLATRTTEGALVGAHHDCEK